MPKLKAFILLPLSVFFLLIPNPGAFAEGESITITTYYPAPFGVYKEMRAKRMAIGDTYYDSSQHCWPGGPCTNPDIDDETSLIVEGKVGIGTNDPGQILDVDGNVNVTGNISATEYCDANSGNCFSFQSIMEHTHPIVTVVKSFSSSGTWVKPENVISVIVDMAGAGGGSGAGGYQGRLSGAGGGAAKIVGQITLPVAQTSYSIVVGQGGAGGVSNNQGGDGGASKLANKLIANGGQGGCPGITSYHSPGMGGQGGTYTLNISLEGIATNGTQRTYIGGAPCYGGNSSSTPESTGIYGGGTSTTAATGNPGNNGYVTLEYSLIGEATMP